MLIFYQKYIPNKSLAVFPERLSLDSRLIYLIQIYREELYNDIIQLHFLISTNNPTGSKLYRITVALRFKIIIIQSFTSINSELTLKKSFNSSSANNRHLLLFLTINFMLLINNEK